MSHLGNEYRTYALDFWGFGESGKKRDSYSIDDFVSLVEQFMDQLGIVRAPIIGHSMGGTVSMAFAAQYPDRVTKVGVIGSPVAGDSLAWLLKLAGKQTIATIVFNALWALKLGIKITAPLITKDKRWPDMINSDLSQTTLEAFLLSIKSLRTTDLSEELKAMDIPIMALYGLKDNLVNPNQKDLIKTYAQHPQLAIFKKAGHFPMLDQPEDFMRTLKLYLDGKLENYSIL